MGDDGLPYRLLWLVRRGISGRQGRVEKDKEMPVNPRDERGEKRIITWQTPRPCPRVTCPQPPIPLSTHARNDDDDDDEQHSPITLLHHSEDIIPRCSVGHRMTTATPSLKLQCTLSSGDAPVHALHRSSPCSPRISRNHSCLVLEYVPYRWRGSEMHSSPLITAHGRPEPHLELATDQAIT